MVGRWGRGQWMDWDIVGVVVHVVFICRSLTILAWLVRVVIVVLLLGFDALFCRR